MVWKAKLQSVQDNPVLNDTVTMDVVYVDGGRQFTTSYKVRAGTMVSRDDVKALITAELARLNTLDTFRALVQPLVGVNDVLAEIERIR